MSTLTQKGYATFQKELEALQKITRPAIIEKVQKARSMGDLSENNAYHAAREELAFIEGRILELQSILKSAHVIPAGTATSPEHISLGAQVLLEGGTDKSEIELTLVGEFEANPREKKVSNLSPLGRAVEGKKRGDKVMVITPAGTQEYVIKQVVFS